MVQLAIRKLLRQVQQLHKAVVFLYSLHLIKINKEKEAATFHFSKELKNGCQIQYNKYNKHTQYNRQIEEDYNENKNKFIFKTN